MEAIIVSLVIMNVVIFALKYLDSKQRTKKDLA